jgi:hypothetical protein
MDGARPNDTPGLGLEVGLPLAVAAALGLTLAVTWNTHGMTVPEYGVKMKSTSKAMGTCLGGNWKRKYRQHMGLHRKMHSH